MNEEAATPRPWRVFTNKDGTKLVGIGGQDGEGVLDAGFGVWSWNDPEGIANAELVVRSVNSLPALVKALEMARTYIEYSLDTHGNDIAGNGMAALNALDRALATVKDLSK